MVKSHPRQEKQEKSFKAEKKKRPKALVSNEAPN